MSSFIKYVGLAPPTPYEGGARKKTYEIYRSMYWTSVTTLVIFLVCVFIHHHGIGTWGIIQDLPIMWSMQIFCSVLGVLIAGQKERVLHLTMLLNVFLVIVIIYWSVAIVFVIDETQECANLDSETEAALRECHQKTNMEFLNGESTCGAELELQTRATGSCPTARFGTAGGTAWIIWQFFIVLFMPGIDIYLVTRGYKLREGEEKDLIKQRSETVQKQVTVPRQYTPANMTTNQTPAQTAVPFTGPPATFTFN